MCRRTYVWYVFTNSSLHNCTFAGRKRSSTKTHLFSPGEHDGNEPEILAAILDELTLELHGTQSKGTSKKQGTIAT